MSENTTHLYIVFGHGHPGFLVYETRDSAERCQKEFLEEFPDLPRQEIFELDVPVAGDGKTYIYTVVRPLPEGFLSFWATRELAERFLQDYVETHPGLDSSPSIMEVEFRVRTSL